MDKKIKITTGNTGEWSELYELGSIISNKGVFGADDNQNRKEDLFYEVLKVIFNTKNEEDRVSYEIKDDVVEVYKNAKKIKTVKISKVRKILEAMYKNLLETNIGRAYSIETGSEMMSLLEKEGIKASSSVKKDLDLIILDIKTKQPSPETGFSIKSQLGSPSTLINSSMATSWTFEVLDENGNTPSKIPKLHPKNVKDNVELLINSGYKIVFDHMDSETFYDNLSLIDSNMPEYISKILLSFFSRKATKLADLTNYSFPENKQAQHKIKEFISVMAMGMMSNTRWDGILTSLGGFLLVKRDGDVLCYYLYNLKDFQEYLFKNTKLDTPSTTRYGIGRVYKEDGRYFVKLNLQVRFIK